MIELNLVHVVVTVLAFFLVIELGLTWGLCNMQHSQVSVINFALFSTVWSLVVVLCIALMPPFPPAILGERATLFMLVASSAFWLGGSCALAARVGIPQHANNEQRVTQAATAFGFLIATLFTMMSWMRWRIMREDRRMNRSGWTVQSGGTRFLSMMYPRESMWTAESTEAPTSTVDSQKTEVTQV